MLIVSYFIASIDFGLMLKMLRREILLMVNRRRGLEKLDYALKDYIQDKILYYAFTLSSDVIVFKGGTALFKVYGSPRFSLDLDMTAEGIDFLGKVRTHLRREGFKVHVVKSERRGNIAMFVWNVGAKGLGGTGLKLEIRVSGEFEDHQLINYESIYPDIKPFRMRVITIEYAFRRKIFMLLERGKARDLFDAYFIARTYNVRVSLDREMWLKILSRMRRLEKKWANVGLLLINHPLPPFGEVLEVIRKHVEISG